jgi:hypothetical protein
MTDCRRPGACGHHHLLRCGGGDFRWNKIDATSKISVTLAVECGPIRVPFFDEVVEGDFPGPKNKNHQPDREKYERIRIVELRRVREERGERGLPVPQLPLFPPSRFRVTFAQAGIYNYKCSLRDNLGMVGKVIVLP